MKRSILPAVTRLARRPAPPAPPHVPAPALPGSPRLGFATSSSSVGGVGGGVVGASPTAALAASTPPLAVYAGSTSVPAAAATHRLFSTTNTYITLNKIEPPSTRQLRHHALRAAVPMIGFGFMDNTIMINMGDALDMSIGVTFGLSTLTSAAFGQVFSDVAGVLFGGTIEELANKCGLPDPNLTPEQQALTGVKTLSYASAAGGIVLGCLLGMVSLFFKDLGAAERAKRQKELSTLFDALVEEGTDVLQAQRCTLWLVDGDGTTVSQKTVHMANVTKGQLPSDSQMDAVFRQYDTGGEGYITSIELADALRNGLRYDISKEELAKMMNSGSSHLDKHKQPVLQREGFKKVVCDHVLRGTHAQKLRPGGIKHTVVTTGETINVANAHQHPKFNGNWDRYTGFRTKSLIAVPIKDAADGRVIGVIIAKNKVAKDPNGSFAESVVPFSPGDEMVIKTIASHAASFIRHVNNG